MEKIEINMKRLWELAKSGKSAQELMQELNMKEIAHLQNALEQLMQEKGEKINVPGLIGKAGLTEKYTDKGARVDTEMVPGKEE